MSCFGRFGLRAKEIAFRYPLLPDEDTFVLLENGTLIVLNTGQVLSEDNYCMETVNFGDEKNEEWVTTAILCFTSGEAPLSSAIFIIYAVGTFVILMEPQFHL